MALQNKSMMDGKADELIDSVNEVVALIEREKRKKAEVLEEIGLLGELSSRFQRELKVKEENFSEVNKLISEKTNEMQNCEKIITVIDEGIVKLTECANELMDRMLNECQN